MFSKSFLPLSIAEDSSGTQVYLAWQQLFNADLLTDSLSSLPKNVFDKLKKVVVFMKRCKEIPWLKSKAKYEDVMINLATKIFVHLFDEITFEPRYDALVKGLDQYRDVITTGNNGMGSLETFHGMPDLWTPSLCMLGTDDHLMEEEEESEESSAACSPVPSIICREYIQYKGYMIIRLRAKRLSSLFLSVVEIITAPHSHRHCMKCLLARGLLMPACLRCIT